MKKKVSIKKGKNKFKKTMMSKYNSQMKINKIVICFKQ